MAPEPPTSPSPQDPSARPDREDRQDRLDRLEQQLATLNARLDALEQQHLPAAAPVIFPAATPVAPPAVTPVASPSIPPPVLFPPPPPRASLENRLGSQVFNRIGIVAILIGATWFLKLAVDRGWVGPVSRVLIGLAAGAGLVLWSERFRRKGFAAFSFSLKALGSGVLYLTLWAAFQLYQLLPAPAALLAMLLVTVWNAWMAWSQDAELLAAYALAGGLATPLLLATGGDHEIFLFTYLFAIDLASVALARLRGWPRLLPGAFLATVAYFIGWYTSFFHPPALAVTNLFVLLLAGVFITPPLLPSPLATDRPRLRTLLEDIVLPLAAAAFLSLGLYSTFQDSGHHALLPWLMLLLAAAYLGLMRLPQTQLASAIHLALAVTFLTVAIPLKASGAWITVAWLVEGTALLWAATRTFAAPAAHAAANHQPPGKLALLLLSSASLLLGLGGVFFQLFFNPTFSTTPTPFLNRGFATALTGLVAFALSAWLAHRASATDPLPAFTQLSVALTVAFNLVVVLAFVQQIDLLFRGPDGTPDSALQRALAVSAFLMLYGALLLAAGFWRRSALIRWQALILLVIAIAKTFLYDMRNLSAGYRVLSFLGLGGLLLAVSFAYQKDWLALRDPSAPHPTPVDAKEDLTA